MIGVQLVIAGYQLPAKYNWIRRKEMAMCLLPIMTMMWLCKSACVLATIPKLTFLAALVVGSCVTCTDPILSQATAGGPFADKYVARPLREIISSEAGANDGNFLEETIQRHDEVNSCIDVLLNFGGFMYIGTIIPSSEFHDPDGTGLTDP